MAYDGKALTPATLERQIRSYHAVRELIVIELFPMHALIPTGMFDVLNRMIQLQYTSRLKLDQVANLSVQLFGTDSRYYGQPGVVPRSGQNGC